MVIYNEDSLFVSFRECPIGTFEGAPTYMAINRLNSHLKKGAALLHCDLGDGNLGYLVLTAPPYTHTLLSTLLFVGPTNAGPTLTMPDPEPTELVLSELFQTHVENLRVW